jgi:hypothetical protein
MLSFQPNREHEAAVRAAYERAGMPADAAPTAYIGYAGDTELLRVLVSREQWTAVDERWHVSISCEERVPSWDEIAATLHVLRPGVPFVLGVPPRSWWLNLHPHCLHAWECKDTNLIAQWRANRQGQTPT